MSEREPFPTEDLEPDELEGAPPGSLPDDASEADALEQATPAAPDVVPTPARVDDAPEADALDQAMPTMPDADDDRG